jgi:hypothetical protein
MLEEAIAEELDEGEEVGPVVVEVAFPPLME